MDKLSRKRRRQEMMIVCAWCAKELGEKDGEGVKGVSHGVCEECLRKFGVKSDNEVKDEGK